MADPEKTQEKQRRKFWHLGGRVLKTVVAVFLSLLLDSWRPGGMPFYAAITAVLCVQPQAKDSLDVSVNREIATILGGLAGMGFLFAERWVDLPLPQALRYALAAAALIPLISLSVWLERPKATFLTCVVFLSVVVTHNADVDPFLFPVNRVLDTTIGIAVALAVNLAPPTLFRRRKAGAPEPAGPPADDLDD